MATPTLNDTKVIQTYGNRDDIFSLAKRIKIMVPGGSKLSDPEAQALAQVSLVTQCNPFIGEIWYIPGRGPMIGIKGARRHGNEQTKEAGGLSAYWTANLIVCSGEQAGYKGDSKDLAAAYECIIEDSVSTGMYQKMFLETVKVLRESGSKDPVGEAREICGKRPQWKGYGFSTVSESSKMNKQALAMKRAEADALKRKFDIPFGTEIAAGDTAAETGARDWVEGTSSPAQVEPEDVNQDTGENAPAIELIDPLSDWAVRYAVKAWNVSTAVAKQEIKKKIQGERIEKSDFIEIVTGAEKTEGTQRTQAENAQQLGFGA